MASSVFTSSRSSSTPFGAQVDIDGTSFAGKLLIATPELGDSRFSQAVIYMCVHDEEQSMGIVINKPCQEINLKSMLAQLNINAQPRDPEAFILDGGPLENERGFLLHSRDFFQSDFSLPLSDSLALSTHKSALEALVGDTPPQKAVLALGYAGWDGGQLESEIKRNSWLIAPANEQILFDVKPENRWQRALLEIGVHPQFLSPYSGSA